MHSRLFILLSFIFFGVTSCGGGLCGVNGEGCSSPPPSVGSASSVDSGDGTGSVTVTITGTGFVNGMTVTVNGNDCTNVKVITSTQATCTLPNGQIALVNIIITSPNGSSGGSSLSSPLVSSTATSTAFTDVSADWENINNALASDGLVASINQISNGDGDRLHIKGYFSSSAYTFPTTAVIDGIKAKCRWRTSSGNVSPSSSWFYLTKAGVEAGNNKAENAVLPQVLGYSSDYGGINDLWGTTWTPAQINDPGFGISLGFNLDDRFYVDNCQISVYWH